MLHKEYLRIFVWREGGGGKYKIFVIQFVLYTSNAKTNVLISLEHLTLLCRCISM